MLEYEFHSRVLALTGDFAQVLSGVGALGPAFLVARNEACLMGGVANGLRYAEVGHRHMAWTGDFSLQFSTRSRPVVLAYSEAGMAGDIEGIEFFDRYGCGCLKVCRTADIDSSDWQNLVGNLTRDVIDRHVLSGLRKTNHLNSSTCCKECRRKRERLFGFLPSVEQVSDDLEAFLQQAIDEERRLEVTLPCGLLRAQSAFLPRELNWIGQWAYIFGATNGCHLRVTDGSAVAIMEKAAGVRVLSLFDDCGRFTVRLVSRPKSSK
jgi:Haemin-degrading HemS.ChuX domain